MFIVDVHLYKVGQGRRKQTEDYVENSVRIRRERAVPCRSL